MVAEAIALDNTTRHAPGRAKEKTHEDRCDRRCRLYRSEFRSTLLEDHPDVDVVVEATRLAREKAPELAIEGPIQFDAAVDEAVASKKLPGSEVAGKAPSSSSPRWKPETSATRLSSAPPARSPSAPSCRASTSPSTTCRAAPSRRHRQHRRPDRRPGPGLNGTEVPGSGYH